VTRQETIFTQTTSRKQRLQTKTPQKEHVSMTRQAECELVSKLMSWFSP